MRPITRHQLDRLTDDIARLHTTLQNRTTTWHAIQVLNTATGNTTPATNPNSSGAEQCNCHDGTNCPHGTPTEKAALTYDPDLLADNRALATLQRLMRDAITAANEINSRTGTPRPAKCRVCSTGMIPVGISRCDNEQCNSHGDTVVRCAIQGCEQRLITGTVGKTKPHTIDNTDGKVCRTHYLEDRKTSRYDRVKAERGTSTIDLELDNNLITGEDAA